MMSIEVVTWLASDCHLQHLLIKFKVIESWNTEDHTEHDVGILVYNLLEPLKDQHEI